MSKTGIGPQYTDEVTAMPTRAATFGQMGGGERDELFADSVRVVAAHDRASASLLQRRLAIGYARAARILDQLEASGVVGPADGSKPREVILKDAEAFLSQQKEQQQ